jgi:methyl-accepting chemotaxis protein
MNTAGGELIMGSGLAAQSPHFNFITMLKTLRIRTQLSLGFGLVIAMFTLGLLVVGVLASRLNDKVDRIANETLASVVAVGDMDLQRSQVQQFLTDVSATHDRAAYAEADAAAASFMKDVELLKRQPFYSGDPEAMARLAKIEAEFASLQADGKRMAEAYIEDGIEAGNLLMKGTENQPGFDQASERMGKSLADVHGRQMARADEIVKAAAAESRNIISTMVMVGVVAGLVALIAAHWMARSFVRQVGGELGAASELARHVAQGDLSTEIPVHPKDKSSLMAQLKVMQESLVLVVKQVHSGSDAVATASEQIAQGNHDLSARTEQQASALEQTSSSMANLGSTVSVNAEHANTANDLARQASSVAVQGGKVVADVVGTMRGISEASQKISDITSVIDSIAFQTNILALNAAVEAARAGEQGRGFAVVAAEVRTLAQRSAQAAKEIKGLIADNVERVDQGAELVNRAGHTMQDVVNSIRRVADIVADISSASQDQSRGVSEVGQAIHQMDQGTQQNAALVEEMAAAASGLSVQARQLVQTVSVFRLRPSA